MFSHPAWAVGSYSSGSPAARTVGIKLDGSAGTLLECIMKCSVTTPASQPAKQTARYENANGDAKIEIHLIAKLTNYGQNYVNRRL